MRNLSSAIALFILVLMLSACPSKKEGSLEGQISPAGPGIRIAVLMQGKTIAQTEAALQDGTFKMTLQAGTYDIRITTPASPYPLSLSAVVVKAGEATVLAPISLSVPKGTGRISGKVLAAGAGTRVALHAEGIERASVNVSEDGKYEFEGLPAGSYTLQVRSPGYADDSATVSVSDDRGTARDIRMLYITAIEGIDWKAGTIRSRGIGFPPKQAASTPTVRRELAKRAALADAERTILRMLELITIAPGQKLDAAFGDGFVTQKLSGFLRGYRIAAERDMDGGKLEVEIELPLTGPGGLSSYVQP